jgi:hypothetical protein
MKVNEKIPARKLFPVMSKAKALSAFSLYGSFSPPFILTGIPVNMT